MDIILSRTEDWATIHLFYKETDGPVLQNDAAVFFKAFPKQINGLFEHF